MTTARWDKALRTAQRGAPKGRAFMTIEKGAWVSLGRNIGQIVGDAVEAQERTFVPVRFITEGGPFSSVEPVLIDTTALAHIDGEPRLSRSQASWYTGMTPAALYRLRDKNGLFGGVDSGRDFMAYPSELDSWLFSEERTKWLPHSPETAQAGADKRKKTAQAKKTPPATRGPGRPRKKK